MLNILCSLVTVVGLRLGLGLDIGL